MTGFLPSWLAAAGLLAAFPAIAATAAARAPVPLWLAVLAALLAVGTYR